MSDDNQKWPRALILMRHGQSERNKKREEAKEAGLFYNYSEGVRDQDTPLTPIGHAQTYVVGTSLREEFSAFCPKCHQIQTGYISPDSTYPYCLEYPSHGFGRIDTIFVSPYLRTRQSAEGVIKGLGYSPQIVVEERIREIEFGILDGLSPEGVAAKYPEEVARKKREGKYFYRAAGGENRPDVNLRIHSFLGTLTRSARQKNVLIVCHSVVVMCFRHLLERWGEDDYLQVDKENDVRNASLTIYNGCNKLVLEAYNKIVYPEPQLDVKV
jgi:2,3-bisphosphoglycerate-dependent phosphoglycerate mutase